MSTLLPYLWRKPDTAHPYDDEFEGPITFGSGSDGKWYYTNNGTSGSFSTDPIDVYTTYNSGDTRVHINETHTPSWLRVQPPQDSNFHTLRKKITFPTNMLVYCRFRFTQNINEGSSGNPHFRFSINDGTPHLNDGDSNSLKMAVSSGVLRAAAMKTDGGSVSELTTTTDVDDQGQALEYFFLHKVGNTYHYWAATESNFIYLGSYTNAYTPTEVVLEYHNHNDQNIISMDFVRFIETDEFPF